MAELMIYEGRQRQRLPPTVSSFLSLASAGDQTSATQWKNKLCLVSPDSSGTPGEEEEGERKEDQQKVSFFFYFL